jgi:hypothetical protein
VAERPEDLRARLDEAYAAADRLVDEAGRQAQARAEAAGVPPRGWEVPRDDPADPFALPELETLRGLLAAARSAVPPDIQHQFVAALRELLLALRALIDWYLERLERTDAGAPEVEDIPIR